MLARLVNGLKPCPPPLSSQKNEILFFGLRSTSDDQLGWVMDSNPIHCPSPAKKMKCSFLGYIQLLMIGRAGRWTQTSSTTSLQPKKWNPYFCITLNFWWSAKLVDGLEPHLPPLSLHKNEMLILVLHSISDVGQTGQWTQTPSTTLLQPKKWNAYFWIMFTSDDWPGWLMDSNPIHQLSPAKNWNAHFWITFNFWWSAGLVCELEPQPSAVSSQKMKCSYFDYVQLLMIGRAGQWTWTPSTSGLQPKKWNAHFWITFSSDDLPGWLMNLNPIHHPSPAKKMKCSFFEYIQLLMISLAGQWTRTPSATWATLVEKDWKSCKSGKINHSESFWATSVGKHWKSCKSGEMGHSESFWATLVEKDWESCESGKIGHSESFWATLVGKHWKSWKSGEMGHSNSFWATLVGKDWKSCKSGKIGHSESFWATLVGKDWKSAESGKIGHSESFWAT